VQCASGVFKLFDGCLQRGRSRPPCALVVCLRVRCVHCAVLLYSVLCVGAGVCAFCLKHPRELTLCTSWRVQYGHGTSAPRHSSAGSWSVLPHSPSLQLTSVDQLLKLVRHACCLRLAQLARCTAPLHSGVPAFADASPLSHRTQEHMGALSGTLRSKQRFTAASKSAVQSSRWSDSFRRKFQSPRMRWYQRVQRRQKVRNLSISACAYI